jgi:hypothetical protein
MRRIIIRIIAAGIFLAAIAALWIFDGPRLSRSLGRTFSVRLATLPANPLLVSEGEEGTYHGADFNIGGKAMSAESADFRAYPLRLRPDAQRRMILTADGKTFPLGPVTASGPDDVGRTVSQVAGDPGDEISFTLERGRLTWPTPFRTNFMTGGRMPSWSGLLFYVLVWRKRSGERLEMVWRFPQDFDAVDGWKEVSTGPGSGGLIRVSITP